MPYTVIIKGVEVRAETPEDAIRLAEAAASSAPRHQPLYLRGRDHKEMRLGRPTLLNRDAVLTLFTLLRDRHDAGAPSLEVSKVLGLSAPRSLGRGVIELRGILGTVGLTVDEVISHGRDDSGRRVWKAGRKIGDAIQLLST
jgi:hypothetical protein